MRRLIAVIDRALPYLGPALALIVGLVGLGRRSLDVDEAVDRRRRARVVHRRRRAGVLRRSRACRLPRRAPATSSPGTTPRSGCGSPRSSPPSSRPSRRTGSDAGWRVDTRAPPPRSCSRRPSASSGSPGRSSRSRWRSRRCCSRPRCSRARLSAGTRSGGPSMRSARRFSRSRIPSRRAPSSPSSPRSPSRGGRSISGSRSPPRRSRCVESCLFLTAAVIDRADAADGAGSLELGDIAMGLAHGLGWNAIVVALSVWGIVVLVRRTSDGEGRWKPVLVGAWRSRRSRPCWLRASPCPSTPAPRSPCAPVVVALAAGIGLVAIRRPEAAARRRRAAWQPSRSGRSCWTRCARMPEDWRAAVALVRRQQSPSDTVVVLPERARSAFAYYAPELRVGRVGRGEAVSVVVAGEPDDATATARAVVSPPRYALLSRTRAAAGSSSSAGSGRSRRR